MDFNSSRLPNRATYKCFKTTNTDSPILVEIVQYKNESNDGNDCYYGIAIKRANTRSNAFVLTQQAFEEIVSAAPSLLAKIAEIDNASRRSIADTNPEFFNDVNEPKISNSIM